MPPPAINASAVQTSTAPNRVDLRWPASVPNAASAGLQGYVVYRDGVYLGRTRVPSWLDQTVDGPESTTYSIYVEHQHGGISAPASITVQVPEDIGAKPKTGAMAEIALHKPSAKNVPYGPTADQREIGLTPAASYWGAAGENIGLLSGNLNFTIPLIKAVGRGTSSVSFNLSYNSQMWRQDVTSGFVWPVAQDDLGVGLGWKLQAGSILPQWYNGSQYFFYTDATGAQYVIDQCNPYTLICYSLQTYVWYDANLDTLHFPNGSFWKMNITSLDDADHGTLYPSQMEDSNGNFISLTYTGYAGCLYPCVPNESSRIQTINDARGAPRAGYGSTYTLEWWSGSGLPHLVWIANDIGSSESYTFSTASQTLLDPFTSSNFSAATVLLSASVNGLGIGHQFQYKSSGEMTQLTTPLGGVLNWGYSINSYATRRYRTVTSRSMTALAGQGQFNSWGISYQSTGGADWHSGATVTDSGANTQKAWSFNTQPYNGPGLVTTYREIDSTSTTLLEKDYMWQAGSSQPPFVYMLTSTLNPGTSYAASTTTTTSEDFYGNVTQMQISDYSGSPTGQRNYNMSYTASMSNYSNNYVFNRRTSATVSQNYGNPYTLSSVTYDGGTLATSSATTFHEPRYSNTFYYRGNPTTVSGLNGSDSTFASYDSTGAVTQSSNASGQSVSLQTDPTTNYTLPTVIQPNGSSTMATTMTYENSWAPATMTGPNGEQGTTSYDSYGRPSWTQSPDSAITGYSYTYYNPTTHTGANTQTATVDGRWQTTTVDGFGRTTRVQLGNGTTVVSTVDTQYAPCACSPLGKMSAVSEPYAPNATVYWTRYTYDGAGRTVRVTAADGNSATTYSYQGNSTTVTDPASKWKTSTVDAYGNVIQVTEPNPSGGTFNTYYTYTSANQLTGVSMTRGNVTQTRTFLYNGSDLVSATNPEDGTVTYTYDGGHHVTNRTDAGGNQTQYHYDDYGRLTQVQYYPYGFSGGEDMSQRVNYYYDNSVPPAYSGAAPVLGTGRLTGVGFAGGVKDSLYYAHFYTYVYSYNAAGRVTTQTSSAMAATGNNYNNLQPVHPAFATMTIGYQWDSEGRMTSMAPSLSLPTSWPTSSSFPTMGYQYDPNGRMNTMTSDGSTFATAAYYPTGQLYQLSSGGLTETRTYNTMMQLISQSVPGFLNMTYTYSGTQNNGRITSSADGITGENTSYTYDALNRLVGASSASRHPWSGSYGYDGFGNLTSKSGSGGSPNGFPSMTASYNAKNQLTTASYDANGNTTAANGYWYSYTVENKLNYLGSQTWPYPDTLYGNDPSGKRVMKETNPDPGNYEGLNNPFWEFYFYTITGQRLVTIDCNNANAQGQPNCWTAGENVYFGNRMLVSNGLYVFTDRVGTVRANSLGSQHESFAYYPYGEERTNTVDSRDKFATYFRDAPGLDYAGQRYYNAGLGRFWSPDPGGASTASPSDPASWNRYAYVQGDPVNYYDPSGTFMLIPDPGTISTWTPPPVATTLCGINPAACSPFGLGATGRGSASPASVGAPPPKFSKDCLDALTADNKGTDSITRALAAESTLKAAVKGTNISWEMLAAIGVRESGFEDLAEKDGAHLGVGVFQQSVGDGFKTTADQAHDLTFSANATAKELNDNFVYLQAKWSFTPAQLLQATAASYNLGTDPTKGISGNPDTIDAGSSGAPYGANILALMKCFK